MVTPIWKDYYVILGDVSSAEYSITLVDGTIIFSGKAYRRPGMTSLKVKINDICADYLEQLCIEESANDGFAKNTLAVTFKVVKGSSVMAEVTFVNDWSYDLTKEDDGVLSSPINGVFDVRMPLLYSISEAATINIDAQDTAADFNIDFSKDFSIGDDRAWQVVAGSAGTLTLRDVFAEKGDVTINGKVYHGVSSCATHALYYVNAFGGWDFLLLDGRVVETDNYVRKEASMEYDNREISARGSRNYVNEVSKTFFAQTGWLFGDQGKKMHHLLGSTMVYLYDIEKDKMLPVVLSDTLCKYKTYKSEGGRLVNYTLNLRLAQNRVRR